MKSKKLITAVISIFAALALVVTGYAVTRYKFKSASGESTSLLVNRVSISVQQTEFTFDKPVSDGILECRSLLTIKKNEPDFYASLDSVTLSGNKTEYVVFTAGKNNGDAVLPENVFLPVNEKGEVQPLEWDITFAIPYEEGKSEYNLSLDLFYTSGVKTNVTQTYKTSVPITVTVK